MDRCKCGSYAINPSHHGRDNTDLDLCDVCYWHKRAEDRAREIAELLRGNERLIGEIMRLTLLVENGRCMECDKYCTHGEVVRGEVK